MKEIGAGSHYSSIEEMHEEAQQGNGGRAAMTAEFWYGSKPTNPGEQNVLIYLYDYLQAKPEHYILLCNFCPGRGNEIDLLVLKRNGFFIAELKHYWTKVRGGREGAWFYTTQDDQECEFENPFKQLKENFFGWKEWRESQREKLQQILEKPWSTKMLMPWSYIVFYPELHPDSQIDIGDYPIMALGLPGFRAALDVRSDAKLDFPPERLAQIPQLLNLTKWQIEATPQVMTEQLPNVDYQPPVVCMLVHRERDTMPPFHVIQTPVLVGRAPGCDLVINDASISRIHAEIYRKDNYWVVKDLNSRNHTFVSFSGDPRLERQIDTANAIKNGSIIRFGQVSFTFLLSE